MASDQGDQRRTANELAALALEAPRTGSWFPRVAFVYLTGGVRKTILPRLHESVDAIRADALTAETLAAVIDGFAERLLTLDDDAQVREERNASAVMDAVLKYSFVRDIHLSCIVGPAISQEQLKQILRFSVRSTWIGRISGPVNLDTFDNDELDLTALQGYGDVAFILGPGYSHFFPPGERAGVDGADIFVGRSGKTSKFDIRLEGTLEQPILMVRSASAGEKDRIPAEYSLSPPEGDSSRLADGAFALIDGDQDSVDWLPLLHPALDATAPRLAQEVAPLTRERSDADLTARSLLDRYAGGALSLSPREHAYLDVIIAQLDRSRRVTDVVAHPPTLLESTLTSGELEYKLLGTLIPALQRAIPNEMGPDDDRWRSFVEETIALSEARQTELVPEVRSSRRRIEHRLGQASLSPDHHYLFHSTLSYFAPDSREVQRSLDRQATLLQVLNGLVDYDIELSYRLYTMPSAGGELGAVFEIEASVHGCDSALASELRESFGELVHSAFVGAYGMNLGSAASYSAAGDERRMRQPRHSEEIVRLRGADGTFTPYLGRPDWGHVVDYIRTLDAPVAIHLTARAGGRQVPEVGPLPVPLPGGRERARPHEEDGASAALDDVIERVSAASDLIRLRVAVESNAPIAIPLLNLIGTEVGGASKFDTWTGPLPAAESARQIMPIAEAFRIFHAPFGEFFAGSAWQRKQRVPARVDAFPLTGLYLGRAYRSHAKMDSDIEVRVPENDMLRHMYVIGRTGAGKTNLLRGMSTQHVTTPGTGVAIIDPHGDLAEHVLNSVPSGRTDEVFTIDVTDPDFVPVLNPLLLGKAGGSAQSRVVADVLELVKQRLYYEWAGPRFDEIVRLAIETMLDPGYPVVPSLVDIPRLLTDETLQAQVAARLHDAELRSRWTFHRTKLSSGREYAETMDWAASKFDDISRDESLRVILGGERNTVDLDQVVRENGILIVKLSESAIGRRGAALIGSLVLQRLRAALLRRERLGGTQGKFFIYVDEFQKFATSGFEELVAEARKYGVGAILAHQNLEQLRAFSEQSGTTDHGLLSAILGNVGSMICFGVGAPDVGVISSQFSVSEDTVKTIGKFDALARLTVDGSWVPTFTLTTELHDQELDPRRLRDIKRLAIELGRLLPRSDVSEAVIARRDELERVRAEGGATPSVTRAAPVGSSLWDGWVKKRAEAVSNGTPVRRGDAKGRATPRRRGKRNTPQAPAAEASLSSPKRDEEQAERPPRSRGASNGARSPRASRRGDEQVWAETVGPVVRLTDLADSWNEPVEILRSRATRGDLLILRTQRGTEVTPKAHLGGSGGLIAGLSEVLAVLERSHWSDWSRAAWLAAPREALGGKSVVDWLAQGEAVDLPVELVLATTEAW